MFDYPRIYAIQIILVFLLVGGQTASAQNCVVDSPRYNLNEDTVSWSMAIASGRTCSRGVRFGNVTIEGLKLVSSPQSGQVVLHGPGFTYAAKADFRGEDSFSLAVTGEVNKTHGRSIIHVAISVTDPSDKLKVQDDNSPPSISIIDPPGGTLVSGSAVTLTATATDNVAVASVQFIIDGKYIGPPITAPPYTTTWNSTGVADGSRTIYAVGRDTFGNYGTSSISIIVKNTLTK